MKTKFKLSETITKYRNRDDLRKFLLILLLLFLIIPRITIYFTEGLGSYTVDAEARYFPQAKSLLVSWNVFFSHTGPAYSALLSVFQRFMGDMVIGPVVMQHMIGILTAILTFMIFKNINAFFAFFVTVLVFCSERSVVIEHTILRESIASFFLVLTVYCSINALKKRLEKDSYKLMNIFLAGLSGLSLCLVRLEFIILIIVIFLFIFIIKRKYLSPANQDSGAFLLKCMVMYVLPFVLITLGFYSISTFKFSQYGGTKFNIAYHSLRPNVFYYSNSKYPELLKSYQKIVDENKTVIRLTGSFYKKNDDDLLSKYPVLSKYPEFLIKPLQKFIDENRAVSRSMESFYKITDDYLLKHHELKMTNLQLMDDIFIEIITKNPVKYIQSYLVNLMNQALGEYNQMKLVNINPTGNQYIDALLWIFNFPTFYLKQLAVNVIMLLLSAIIFPYFLLNSGRFNKLPIEISLSLVIVAVHLLVISGISNPVSRFRYPIDPFYFAVPIYGIFLLGQRIRSGKSGSSDKES